MAKQTINIGSSPNDGTGDTIRTVGTKINDNFTELYTTFGDGSNLSATSNIDLSAIDSDIVPDSDGTRAIGTSLKRFSTLHVDNIDLNGTTLNGQTTLTDPNAYSLMGWNDSSNDVDWFPIGAGLTLTGTTLSADVTLGANTFTAAQNFGGQLIESYLNKVIPAVSGSLTDSEHSGNILITSGNVTVPKVDGFTCILVSGGAHTVTFNALTSTAMAAGDLMTIIVEDSDTIHAVLTASANKVSFA